MEIYFPEKYVKVMIVSSTISHLDTGDLELFNFGKENIELFNNFKEAVQVFRILLIWGEITLKLKEGDIYVVIQQDEWLFLGKIVSVDFLAGYLDITILASTSPYLSGDTYRFDSRYPEMYIYDNLEEAMSEYKLLLI